MKKNIVINYILEQIEKGKWKEGNKIFSEYQFQQALKVSCGTVRSAIKELNDKNILETVHGSGTYVVKKPDSQKKYILILTNDNIMNITNNTYKKLLNKLKILIEEKDYIPLCYAKNTFSVEESFNTIINDIVGVIAIFPERKEIEYFKERKIPIIHGIRSFSKTEPSVIVDYEKFFQKIRELIEKYNFSDIMIFMNKLDMSKNIKEILIFLFMEKYFEKYNLKKVGYNNEVMITKEILGIKKSPDCIIFMDDYIYNHAKPNINQNPCLKNTKIITHSSYENRENEPNTCKLIFDMDRIAKEGIELIIKLIEKKPMYDFNIFISPKIENEEALKS